MVILRIKQAECALGDGRLDEAYELVSAEDLRSHRRGQELAGAVARALVKRGAEHFSAGRLAQADSDAAKAARLAGNLPEVAELRKTVAEAVLERQRAEQRRAQVLAAARQQIQQGQLTLGQKILSTAQGDDPAAAALLQDVEARRALTDTIIVKATDALKRDDWEAAIEELSQAKPNGASDARLRALVGQVTAQVAGRVTTALQSGRLDLARTLLSRLQRVAAASVEAEQLARMLEQCRLGWDRIQSGRFQEAEEIVHRLSKLLPEAQWIGQVLGNLQQVNEAMESIRTGPFGLMDVTRTYRAGGEGARRGAECKMQNAKCKVQNGSGEEAVKGDLLPERFMLQIDGVGSFCVVRSRQVTIGPVSSSRVPDLALLAEAHTPVATIERNEDDYFLRAPVPVEVNDRPAVSKLLGNGDRIELSARCRFGFHLPSPASTSAVLDLSGARLPRADVRKVILLDRELIIGPGSHAHIRCDSMAEPFVLFVREGCLYGQAKSEIRIDEKPAGNTAHVPLASCVQVGTLSFAVTV